MVMAPPARPHHNNPTSAPQGPTPSKPPRPQPTLPTRVAAVTARHQRLFDSARIFLYHHHASYHLAASDGPSRYPAKDEGGGARARTRRSPPCPSPPLTARANPSPITAIKTNDASAVPTLKTDGAQQTPAVGAGHGTP